MESDPVVHVCNANESFSKDLYQVLSKTDINIFYSPLSAHAILSLLLHGATGNTAFKLKEALHLRDTKISAEGYQEVMNALDLEENVKLHIANKIFLHEKYILQEKFDYVATKYFWSETENISFFPKTAEAAAKINDWVSIKTNNKINGIISQNMFNKDTRLVLVNAIYFNGQWKHQFFKNETLNEEFYVSETETIECSLMKRQSLFQYSDDSYLDAQVLLVPYKNEKLKMLIILPKSRHGIRELEKKLETVNLRNLDVFSAKPDTKVILSLPKFKTEATINMQSALQELGLGILFDKNCELGTITYPFTNLGVSSIIQKAYIEVSEEGIEAAAVTTGTCIRLIKGRRYVKRPVIPPIIFKANHPFFFCICYNRGGEEFLPVFSGKEERPSLF